MAIAHGIHVGSSQWAEHSNVSMTANEVPKELPPIVAALNQLHKNLEELDNAVVGFVGRLDRVLGPTENVPQDSPDDVEPPGSVIHAKVIKACVHVGDLTNHLTSTQRRLEV